MTIKMKSGLIIGTFASAAMAWSAATAPIPILGPVLADTSGLTAISVAMAYSLSVVYHKNLDSAALTSFAAVVLGAILGNLGLKVFAGLIPVFGSGVNAALTGTLHTAIGLGICKIYDEGGELSDFSSKEFRRIVEGCKAEAKEEKDRYDAAYSALSYEGKKRVDELKKKLKKETMSDQELNQIQNEIAAIFGFSF